MKIKDENLLGSDNTIKALKKILSFEQIYGSWTNGDLIRTLIYDFKRYQNDEYPSRNLELAIECLEDASDCYSIIPNRDIDETVCCVGEAIMYWQNYLAEREKTLS